MLLTSKLHADGLMQGMHIRYHGHADCGCNAAVSDDSDMLVRFAYRYHFNILGCCCASAAPRAAAAKVVLCIEVYVFASSSKYYPPCGIQGLDLHALVPYHAVEV